MVAVHPSYRAAVVGASAGGLQVLTGLLGGLPADYSLPVLVVQHRHKDQRELLEEVLQSRCAIRIKQADEKEPLRPGVVYLAPPDYHMLVEPDFTVALSVDPPVGYSRPSIDVLFQSAADVYGPELVAVILSGANHDGAEGIMAVKQAGGLTIAQDPAESAFPVMPKSAIATGQVAHVWGTPEILSFLLKVRGGGHG